MWLKLHIAAEEADGSCSVPLTKPEGMHFTAELAFKWESIAIMIELARSLIELARSLTLLQFNFQSMQ